MVGHDDLEYPPRRFSQRTSNFFESATGDSTIFEGPPVSGVDSDYQQLAISKYRFELGIEVLAIGTKRTAKTFPYSIERNIVVSRDHERRHLKPVYKLSSLTKLIWLGPLGKVARDHDQIGTIVSCESEHAFRQL